jgi:hypothetical protein
MLALRFRRAVMNPIPANPISSIVPTRSRPWVNQDGTPRLRIACLAGRSIQTSTATDVKTTIDRYNPNCTSERQLR